MKTPDVDAVTALINDVAATTILPLFRKLLPEHVERKPSAADPEDIVTIVDRQVEESLTRSLTALMPSVPVIGEEAVHADPDLLQTLHRDEPVWLLDPIDGTKNFARGDERFGVMLAWIVGGHARAAWIVVPARKDVFVAESGGGAFRNGQRVHAPQLVSASRLRGSVHERYMTHALRESVESLLFDRVHLLPDTGCAAFEYMEILTGERDFAVYFRLLPWDHAAPALVLTEGGGFVEHADGTPYTARSQNQITAVGRTAHITRRIRGWLPIVS